jgi:hypothetical protein
MVLGVATTTTRRRVGWERAEPRELSASRSQESTKLFYSFHEDVEQLAVQVPIPFGLRQQPFDPVRSPHEKRDSISVEVLTESTTLDLVWRVEIVGFMCIRGIGVSFARGQFTVIPNEVISPGISGGIQETSAGAVDHRPVESCQVATHTRVDTVRILIAFRRVRAPRHVMLDRHLPRSGRPQLGREIRLMEQAEAAGETEVPPKARQEAPETFAPRDRFRLMTMRYRRFRRSELRGHDLHRRGAIGRSVPGALSLHPEASGASLQQRYGAQRLLPIGVS